MALPGNTVHCTWYFVLLLRTVLHLVWWYYIDNKCNKQWVLEIQRSMDIGNFFRKNPGGRLWDFGVIFFCNITGNFCTKFGFTTIWSQVAQDFGTLLSPSFRQDFCRISFRWRSWNMIWRETSEGGRRILEGFWGASNFWAICSGLENCWAICSGLLGTYAWCLSFYFWWPISQKVGFD